MLQSWKLHKTAKINKSALYVSNKLNILQKALLIFIFSTSVVVQNHHIHQNDNSLAPSLCTETSWQLGNGDSQSRNGQSPNI